MNEQIEDPTDETVGRAVSATLMAGSLAGRRLADRLREQALAREQAEQAEASRLAQRYEAQRAAAWAAVEQADERWLRTASPEHAADAYSTARAWSEVDPAFTAHAGRLERGIGQRWGVDVAGADEAALRREADAQRSRSSAEDRAAYADEVAVGAVVGGTAEEVERLESAAAHRSEAERASAAATATDSRADAAGYDTDQRRQELAERARGGGADAATAASRVRAADAYARPVVEATGMVAGQKKARRGGQQSQRTRSGELGR